MCLHLPLVVISTAQRDLTEAQAGHRASGWWQGRGWTTGLTCLPLGRLLASLPAGGGPVPSAGPVPRLGQAARAKEEAGQDQDMPPSMAAGESASGHVEVRGSDAGEAQLTAWRAGLPGLLWDCLGLRAAHSRALMPLRRALPTWHFWAQTQGWSITGQGRTQGQRTHIPMCNFLPSPQPQCCSPSHATALVRLCSGRT